jgi:hypothetical protein
MVSRGLRSRVTFCQDLTTGFLIRFSGTSFDTGNIKYPNREIYPLTFSHRSKRRRVYPTKPIIPSLYCYTPGIRIVSCCPGSRDLSPAFVDKSPLRIMHVPLFS